MPKNRRKKTFINALNSPLILAQVDVSCLTQTDKWQAYLSDLAEQCGVTESEVALALNKKAKRLEDYDLPSNIPQAAQVLIDEGTPLENLGEILYILLRNPDSYAHRS